MHQIGIMPLNIFNQKSPGPIRVKYLSQKTFYLNTKIYHLKLDFFFKATTLY